MELQTPPPTYPDEWLTPEGFHRLYHEGGEPFRTFARQVYDYLETMRPGRSVSFRRYQGSPKLEWCVRTAALFLLSGSHWREYDLMDDRLTIRRHPKPRPAATATHTAYRHTATISEATRKMYGK